MTTKTMPWTSFECHLILKWNYKIKKRFNKLANTNKFLYFVKKFARNTCPIVTIARPSRIKTNFSDGSCFVYSFAVRGITVFGSFMSGRWVSSTYNKSITKWNKSNLILEKQPTATEKKKKIKCLISQLWLQQQNQDKIAVLTKSNINRIK